MKNHMQRKTHRGECVCVFLSLWRQCLPNQRHPGHREDWFARPRRSRGPPDPNLGRAVEWAMNLLCLINMCMTGSDRCEVNTLSFQKVRQVKENGSRGSWDIGNDHTKLDRPHAEPEWAFAFILWYESLRKTLSPKTFPRQAWNFTVRYSFIAESVFYQLLICKSIV